MKETINYGDFAKLEIKVGKIIEVEEIPNKDKLYKLLVDVGEEKPRTIVAGLKQYYKKEALKNKIVIVITNLKPKKLGGFLSEGMLLAAFDEAENKVALLLPDKDVKIGSEIY